MSPMNCPECGYQVSDTARICPNCGSNIANTKNFVKVVQPLSSPKRKNYGKMIAEIVGSVVLIAIGILLINSGIGVVLIILGIIGFLVAFLSCKKTQQGLCPYCNTMLEISMDSSTSFKCPVCNNTGNKTRTTLESTHPLKGDIESQREQIKEECIRKIAEDFHNSGWTEWDASIHRLSGQIERLKRATFDSEKGALSLELFDEKFRIAKINGTSNNVYLVSEHRCSCPDFRERQLPCKHMYYLAMRLVNNDIEQVVPEKKFSGLTFSIVGRNQSPIIEYVESCGGQVSNSSWRSTSAIVLASNIETQRRATAEKMNVEQFSFDDLKRLFESSDI